MAKKKIIRQSLSGDFVKKVQALGPAQPFLATLTVFKAGQAARELETFLFVNNFPYEEIAGTKEKIQQLLEEIK